MTRLALILVRLYQYVISPLLPPSCRFYPSCSEYTYQAIRRFGIGRGSWLGLCRLLRCHPLYPGGYDPVPEQVRSLIPWRRNQPGKLVITPRGH